MDLALQLAPTVESRNFLSFCLPSNAQLEDKGELNEWIERMIFLYEDLKWLLSQSVESFWNQVVFDESWNLCLDSFLQNAPRFYDLKNIPQNCKAALSRVSRLFLLAIKRMSLNDENKDLKFLPDAFGEIIYENYLFDAAKLLDICGIFYRPSNSIRDMLYEIMANIFKYQPKYYDDLSNAIHSMVTTLDNIDERLSASSQSQAASTNTKKKPVNGSEAQDMLLFIFDMAKTVKALVNVFPNACRVLFQANVISRFASLCVNVLPALLKLTEVNRKKFKYMCSEIENELVRITELAFQSGFIKRLKLQSTESVIADLATEYVNIMDGMAQYPGFLSKYCNLGSVSSDFVAVEKLGCIDTSSLDYVKTIVSSVVHENSSDQVQRQLRELLPTKSEFYINECIAKYGANTDVIMNNIMEGNMPDESKTVSKSIVKPITLPDKEILEDNKEHVALLKATYLSPIDGMDEPNYNIYDDEYDDTYDSQNVAAADADSAEELKDVTSRRKFTIPAALRQIGDVSSESSDDEEKKGKDGDQDKGNIQNNAISSRERNGGGFRGGGQRGGRGTRGGNPRGRGRGQPGGNGSRGGCSNDSGRGRGRGRGNKHNRRNLADKKKSKGMFPM